MDYLLFIDESGHDLKNSPYEVIAGMAIRSDRLWAIICKVHELELKHFGTRYSSNDRELKAKRILKKKTFRLANQANEIPLQDRARLAQECLDPHDSPTREKLTALAQSKLAFVREVFDYCIMSDCKVFASISDNSIEVKDKDLLRKDYVYLFERYYYFLKERLNEASGLVIFDELEKSKSHILISQIESYFKKSFKGRERSSLLIPEPFFVHSDLTTGVQLADLVAYVLSWGFRLNGMEKEKRPELKEFVEQVLKMRHYSYEDVDETQKMKIWSITYVK